MSINRGNLIVVCSLVSVVLFSLLLLAGSNLMIFWVFMELASISTIPSFFSSEKGVNVTALFSYLVASSISSCFILLGVLNVELTFVMIIGFLIKFGIFPFWGWLYSVVVGTPWISVWIISGLLKLPIFVLCYFFSINLLFIVDVLSGLSFVFIGLLFWVYTFTWRLCWCHMMLSSGYIVFLCALKMSLSDFIYLFIVYVLWCTLLMWFFIRWENSSGCKLVSSSASYYMFCWLLISTPLSVSIFYKLLLTVCAYSLSWPVFVGWVIYNLLEQAYMIKLVISLESPSSMRTLVSVI